MELSQCRAVLRSSSVGIPPIRIFLAHLLPQLPDWSTSRKLLLSCSMTGKVETFRQGVRSGDHLWAPVSTEGLFRLVLSITRCCKFLEEETWQCCCREEEWWHVTTQQHRLLLFCRLPWLQHYPSTSWMKYEGAENGEGFISLESSCLELRNCAKMSVRGKDGGLLCALMSC